MIPKKKVQQQQKVEEGDNKSKISQGILRLRNDIKSFKERVENYKELPNVILEFPNEETINPVHIVIRPQSGFYKNSQITFIYTIADDYPFSAPIVECKQRVFHPNIDAHKKVCLSVLKTGWEANNDLVKVTYGLWQILECLSNSDIEKPLDARAAELMKQDPKLYQQVVEKTLKGQSFEGNQFDNVWIGK